MLSELKNDNDQNSFLEGDCKYDNQYKKRRVGETTPEKNNIVDSLPSSSPPRSPNSLQSFSNIIIKTPNISRILSHLSIRTPKKNINSNTSSPLNLLKALNNTKAEPDPLFNTKRLFIQTPQPSRPSSPTTASKKDQSSSQLSKECCHNKFNNYKQFKNTTTPKSLRSFNLNSTPTKGLKSINFDLSLTPTKVSESSFNNCPSSPTSLFLITTPTKGKSRTHFIGNDCKNNTSNQDISWFKNFATNTDKSSNEDDIFKYRRMNSLSSLNSITNEYSYRDNDKDSISSITDDTLTYTSNSTSSSSFNILNHRTKHTKNKKEYSSKLNNKTEKFPLSPEPSFLRSTLSESLPSSYSSSNIKNNLSFLSTVHNDIFNHKNDMKMEIVSEIESISDALPFSDISMFIDEDEGNDFIPISNPNNKNSSIKDTENKSLMIDCKKIESNVGNKNTIDNTVVSNKQNINTDENELLSKNSNNSNQYKGFLNTDGIWEDPSLSQCEARNLKKKNPDSDIETDEDMENISRCQSLPSTPKIKYSSNGSSSGPNTPRCRNKIKNHLKKSSESLLLNMDGTASPVCLEKHEPLPSLNSPLRQSFSKNKQLTAVNKLNIASKGKSLTQCRRANSLISTSSSLSSSSTLTAMLLKKSNSFRVEATPSWSARRKRSLIRSNSISDLSESLSSERKRSFSSLDEEDEYTSDASSIRRSPSSLRKLNARRIGKEKLTNNKTNQKTKSKKEKKKGDSSSTVSSLVKSKNKTVVEDEIMNTKDYDQDRMSISTESTLYKTKEGIDIIEDKKSIENGLSPYVDDTLTNLEINEIQNKKKHENKENIHLICNCTETSDDNFSVETPSIVPREMIFVDELGNVYNEQNYKYLSNYTKAIIADELSKRYCRIPLTEILVSNMPEYRQYFDENGQLKPNNFIYVDNDEDEEEDHPEKEKDEGKNKSSRSTSPININIHKNNTESQDQDSSVNAFNSNNSGNVSRCNGSVANNNLMKNDINTTIEFRTEPLKAEKEMIFESTLSPKGKREWQDITKTSLHSTEDDDHAFLDEDEWNTEDHPNSNEYIKKKQTSKKGKEIETEEKQNEKEDEEEYDANSVETIDDKITIIYRTNESKYQLVIPIKLNIYNKKDTLL